MPGQLPFPYNAWDLMNQGPQARVDLQNPRLAQQGLAGVLAQNLQQQGGEQNLQMAQQMQANPMAGMQGMQAMDTRALQQAEAAQRAGIGANNMAAAGQTNAITEVMQGIMGQGYGGQGSPGQGASGALDATELAFALMNQNPGEVREARDRAQFPSGWKAADLNSYRTTDAKDMEVFDSIVSMQSYFPNLDTGKPLSVYKMLKLFEKGIDEGIVRKDDIDAMQSATGSTIAQLIAQAKGLVDAGAEYMPEMGEAIKQQLGVMLQDKMQMLVSFGASHENFGDQAGWGEKARNRAIPYRKETKRYQGVVARLQGARQHTLPDGSTVLVAKSPDGSGYDTIDPVTGEFTD